MKDLFKKVGSKFTLTKLVAIILLTYAIPVITEWAKEEIGSIPSLQEDISDESEKEVEPKQGENGLSADTEGR